MTTRYLGPGTLPAPDTRPLTGTPPAHLPARITVCLWDFSWFTRAGAGEPYEDLDRALAETAERGYTAIRICAAPLLLFGELGLDDLATDLAIEGLGQAPDGGFYGRRTRWYDAPGGYRLNLRERLFDLFDGAARHGLVVILASWEYQQTPAFAADERWFRAIDAVPLNRRYHALGAAFDRMLTALTDAGHRERVALIELHNEGDFSILPDVHGGGEAVLDDLRERHPDVLWTVSYGKPPHLDMAAVSTHLGAAQFHIYSYGVLDDLQRRIDIRSEGSADFPNAMMRSLLRPDAPTPAEYGRPAEWKMQATVVTDQMIYGYDWVEPEMWDAWLAAHYDAYDHVMRREIESRTAAVAHWARRRGVPAIIGEGWVGYTPRDARFEDGPLGQSLAEHGIDVALANGVWGMVLGSNSAPHHPAWADVAWQQAQNARILKAPA